MKYSLIIAYDGSKFYGFQRLNENPTVQKSLEEALSKLDKSPVIVKGAGRTDRGVHANGQCVHFELQCPIPPENLKVALNKMLKPSIFVKRCRREHDSFHARFSVKSKKYTYKIYTGEFNPCLANYYFQYYRKVEIRKWKRCAKLFLGGHDFHNFVSGTRENYDAIITYISFKRRQDLLIITFEGKSFYRYMVRNIVGAMLDYNENKCELSTIKKMLEDKHFNYQLRTAPACGLYLEEIVY